MTTPEIRFRNWQSRVLLSAISRRQPILPAHLPGPIVGLLRSYERLVLRPDIENYRVDRPIFVLGLPRSGTTMLQDTLCRHPKVAYINNTMNRFPDTFCAIDHFRKLLHLDFEIERYLADSVPVSPDGPSDAVSFWCDWFDIDPYSMEYRDINSEEVDAPRRSRINTTLRKILWCNGDPSMRFFNKVIQCTPYVDMLRNVFPDARLIHIVRDPRMTANSMVKLCRIETQHQEQHKLFRSNPDKSKDYFISYPRLPKLERYIADYGLTSIRTTARIWRDVIDIVDDAKERCPYFYEVRYEDLLADPQAQLGRILDFCELPPVPKDNERFWGKVKTIGTIHHRRSYGEFEIVEEICREGMQRHGYQPGIQG